MCTYVYMQSLRPPSTSFRLGSSAMNHSASIDSSPCLRGKSAPPVSTVSAPFFIRPFTVFDPFITVFTVSDDVFRNVTFQNKLRHHNNFRQIVQLTKEDKMTTQTHAPPTPTRSVTEGFNSPPDDQPPRAGRDPRGRFAQGCRPGPGRPPKKKPCYSVRPGDIYLGTMALEDAITAWQSVVTRNGPAHARQLLKSLEARPNPLPRRRPRRHQSGREFGGGQISRRALAPGLSRVKPRPAQRLKCPEAVRQKNGRYRTRRGRRNAGKTAVYAGALQFCSHAQYV